MMTDITDDELQKWFDGLGANDLRKTRYDAAEGDEKERIRQSILAERRAELIYEGFIEAAAHGAQEVPSLSEKTRNEITETVKSKNEFLEKNPSYRDAVESQIDRWLSGAEDMTYGGDVVNQSNLTAFRDAYKTIDQEDKVNRAQNEIKPFANQTDTGLVGGKDQSRSGDDEHTGGGTTQEQEEQRIRSLLSDDNEYEIDKLRIDALKDIGALTEEQAKDAKSSPEKAIEALNEKLPELSDEQFANYESKLTDRIMDDAEGRADGAFSLIPPSMLAQKYAEMSETLESDSASDEEKAKAAARKEKLANRIDQMTDQFADQGQTQDGLYFSDITNIADVKEGYDAMFAVRTHDLQQTVGDPEQANWEDPKIQEAQERINKMSQCASVLQTKMNEYEVAHHIDGLTPDDAKGLEERFDKMDETFKQVQLDDETLGLVSNFKFLDEQGQPKPQFEFENDKGEKVQSHEIPAGAKNVKVIEGSELDTVIQLAQQSVIQDNLATKDDITPEFLKTQLNDKLFENLYAIHTAGEAVKGNYEHKNQLTDKNFLNNFVADLANPEKTVAITPVGYGAGIDFCVNSNAAFAAALNKKIEKEEQPKSKSDNFWGAFTDWKWAKAPKTSVVNKLMGRMANIDKRAAGRFVEEKPSKWKVRGKMAMRLLKSAGMAFAVSTGMTVLAAAAPAAATVAMATAAVAGVALTSVQLVKWNKQRKANGGKPGFKEACKDLVHDRRMLLTMGATALGTAAIAMAGTDFGISSLGTVAGIGLNPATVAGLGAMAVNATNVGMDARKQGLSIGESIVWGVGTGATTLGAGYLGRLAGSGIVDWVNNHTNSHIFKEYKQVGTKTEKGDIEDHRRFNNGTEAQSDRTLRAMCTDEKGHFDQALYDAKRAEMDAFINDHKAVFEKHGYDLTDPSQKNTLINRLATEQADATQGRWGVDNLHATQDVNVDVNSGGNHFVLTDKVMNAHELTGAERQSFLDMFTSSNPKVIEQGMTFFDHTQEHVISGINEINYTNTQTNAAAFDHNKVGHNAAPDATGDLHHADVGATKYDTYVHTDGALKHWQTQEIITKPVYDWVGKNIPWAMGTLGVLGSLAEKTKKLKPRPGSFLDRILGGKKKTTDTPPIIVDNGGKKKEEIVVVEKPEQKKEQEPVTTRIEEVRQRLTEKKSEKPGYGKLLLDEYKIIYGVEPVLSPERAAESPRNEASYKSWLAYNDRVEAERKATGRDIDMYDFLTERRKKLDSMIEGLGDTHTSVTGIARENSGVGARDITDSHGQPKNEILSKADYEKHKDNPAMAAIIANARQSMMQSNLTPDNYSKKVTLSHFMDYLSQYLVSSDFVADGTRDISQNPPLKREIIRKEGDKQHFVADLNEFYFPKKEDNRSFDEKREYMMGRPKDKSDPRTDFWPAARDVVDQMRKIYTDNRRNDPLYQHIIETKQKHH